MEVERAHQALRRPSQGNRCCLVDIALVGRSKDRWHVWRLGQVGVREDELAHLGSHHSQFLRAGIIGGGQRRELPLTRGQPLINHHLSGIMDDGRIKSGTGVRQVQVELGVEGKDIGAR